MDKSEITKAMIDAYDEYTHLSLDRRAFMQKLTVLTGSAASAAAIAPLLAASDAKAQIVPENDARLIAEDIAWPVDAGEMKSGEMKGYLVRPVDAAGKLPAIIVIHENRGLNAHIRDVARRMALEGFVALAPDFLSPAGGTPGDEDQARNMIGALDATATNENAAATVTFLGTHEATNGNVGAVGFCWGGGMVNRLAVNSADLKAGVAYYGAQAKAEDVPAISAPLMLHYAGLDDRINAGIEAYKTALAENGKDFTIHIYDGVNHAFNNDTSAARYDKAAADLAWMRTVEFFKAKLG